MNQVTMLKNELKRDIINNHGVITKEILSTLLATNKTLRDRKDIDFSRLNILDLAIRKLWIETFGSDIKILSSF